MWVKIWEFLCDNDWLIIVIPMAIMTGLFFLAKLVFWGWMFVGMMGLFVVAEIVSGLMTKKTISTQFRRFRNEHKIFAWVIIWAMLIFWLCLICHLLT